MSAALADQTVGDGSDVVLYPHGGPEHAPRLLLLHGLANSATVWTDYLACAPTGFRLWSADLPWRGEGIGSFASSWQQADRPVDAVRAAVCGIGGSARVIVAHSFAANLLLALLDKEIREGLDPLRRYGITGIVLVSPFYRATPEEFTWPDLAHYLNDFHRIMAAGLRVAAKGRLAEQVVDDLGRRVSERVGPYGWTSFFATYLRTPWLALDRITVPCLVLSGDADFAARTAEAAALADRLPNATLTVLPGLGHFPMAEDPDRFAHHVADFLDRPQTHLPVLRATTPTTR